MTFGDESLLREILDQFVKDSRKDVGDLDIYIQNDELEKVQELMHRMAGRTGQIGARELAAKFRQFEIALREDPDQVSKSAMQQIVRNAAIVVEQVEERALAYSI